MEFLNGIRKMLEEKKINVKIMIESYKYLYIFERKIKIKKANYSMYISKYKYKL